MSDLIMSSTGENPKNDKKRQQQQRVKTFSNSESIIFREVFANRRNEIHEYLNLFKYKADNTIVQVHLTGFFRKKGQQENEKEIARRAATIKRYGGI